MKKRSIVKKPSAGTHWGHARFTDFAATALDATPDEIAPDENLISLGLTSVSLMKLRTALLQDGLDIGFAALAEAGSVSGWERLAKQAGKVQSRGPVAAQVKDGTPFALTHVQRAYWLGRNPQIELGGVAAHGYLEISCHDLDPSRLERALNRVIAAHPMLRAVVTEEGEQRILKDVPRYQIVCDDWSTASKENAEALCTITRERMRQQVLDFDAWPMFEIRLSRMPQDQWLMHVSFDILLFDIKSLELWVSQWWQAYSDPAFDVQTPHATFRDHVARIASRDGSDQARKAKEYWQGRLPTIPLGPDLPLKTPTEEISASRFRRVQTRLTRAQWSRISAHAQAQGLTGSAFMMALYARVLAVWAVDPHFSLTVTLFSRDAVGADLDNVIGDFTSLLPLEIDCRAHATMAELSQATQSRLWQDLDNSAHSGIEVLAALSAREKTHGKALIPYVFTSGLGTGESYIDAFSAFGRIVDAAVQTPQLLIDHQVLEFDGGIVVNWDYVAEAFDEAQIQEIAETHLSWLMKLEDKALWHDRGLFAQAPAASVQAPEAEWASEQANRTLTDVFADSVQAYPNNTAIIAADRQITYTALDRASSHLAAELVKEGVQPEELVGIQMRKGWQQVVAVLAILKAGAAYMPIDPTLPDSRANALAQKGRLRIVLRSDQQGASLDGVQSLIVSDSSLTEDAPPVLAVHPRPTDLAYVLFTSGSTGAPKGVMIEHRAALNTVLGVNHRNKVGPDDRLIMVSSLHFDLSVYDLFGSLAAGAALVIPEGETLPDVQVWEHLVRRHNVTLWNSVPALLGLFIDHLEDCGALDLLQQLNHIFLSGDWLPVPLCQKVRTLAPETRLVSMGGPTEASIWQVDFPVSEIAPDWRSIPYGWPLAHHDVRILDHNLNPRPVGVTGEIYLGGVGLARGYWDDPERTNAAFIIDEKTRTRLYRSGDWARWHPEGWIEFIGRTDTQVKVNGVRIELGEIDTTLSAHPKVDRCATVIVSDNTGGNRLSAFYTSASGALHQNLSAWLKERLPKAYVPSTLRRLETLPVTANGKIDRRHLQQLARAETVPAAQRKSDQTEARILKIWSDLLERLATDPEANFFTIGGNSLLATRLASRLSEEFECKFPTVQIFELPTAAKQATFLSTNGINEGSGSKKHGLESRLTARKAVAHRRKTALPKPVAS